MATKNSTDLKNFVLGSTLGLEDMLRSINNNVKLLKFGAAVHLTADQMFDIYGELFDLAIELSATFSKNKWQLYEKFVEPELKIAAERSGL